MLVSVRIGWDHPRSRGVYYAGGAGAGLRLGSSPLARGLRAVDSPAPPRLRIIPARAGFTAPSSSTPTESPDHPRSRGVYSRTDRGLTSRVGSSPLARGLQRGPRSWSAVVRIIPARAGFTSHGLFPFCVFGDYPRSRGVYGRSSPTTLSTEGSSPLARGLLGLKRAYKSRSRIIPARAGFTRAAGRARLVDEDHPRSRGVYPSGARAENETGGSSPLARGLPVDWLSADGARRIIPARAGFTDRSLVLMRVHPDHPRSRGVYTRRRRPSMHQPGSSPLARGLHRSLHVV